MEECRSYKGFLFTVILLLLMFLSMYRPVFSTFGKVFMLEALLTALFILLAIILSLGVYFCKKWAWPGFLIFFSANLINWIALFRSAGRNWSMLALLLITGFGFLASLVMTWLFNEEEYCAGSGNTESVNCSEDTSKKDNKEDSPEKTEEKTEENFSDPVHSGSAVASDFEPGKYVASKTGARYHSPKCDWALKINEKNRVWYKTRREAEKEGKDPCDCTK